ncbi:CPBP family intramembrane glutamic endopeptidase [Peptoniphilus indolicus]|uniref:CAAX amino protease n=2 Tax=Peptoniphilus indolicus TaxID=33030 RepID=G4D146_9FIRM|nr:type II CAAX endopeptidase family protein [Peptoniphilus indolicus]EGY80723.1 CAAX amino protease [Peptoniphilus indolicus ATCC 29427]SUB74829.1 CAAX amino terminal protease self- immunity [Peptoniphilus indolicus]
MTEKHLSKYQVVGGIFLSIVCLVIAQLAAIGVGRIVVKIGIPNAVANIFTGVISIVLILINLKVLIEKVLKSTLNEYRICPTNMKLKYVVIGFLMVIFVIVLLITTGAEFKIGNATNKLEIITASVFFFGIATGIAEESIFRGVILGILEKKLNRKWAILIPSVIFGGLHIIGRDLDIISIIQLMVAGTFVGILFSLITIESNSIWNSAIVHSIWNIVFIGKIINIGISENPESIYNIVLLSKNLLITGGDFGVEASLPSISIYIIFSLVVYKLLKNNDRYFQN